MLSKPLPILSQMPWNVKKLIVDSADTVIKENLSVCSKDFKNLARNSKICFQKLLLKIHTDRRTAYIHFYMDANRYIQLRYVYNRNGHWYMNIQTGSNTFKKDVYFINAVVDQFMKIFQIWRKASLGELKVNFEDCFMQVERYNGMKDEIVNRIRNILLSLNRPVSVTKFDFHVNGTQDDFMKILPYLEVGTLKEMWLCPIRRSINLVGYTAIDMSMVAETDQWKHAEKLLLTYYMTLPFEKWSHFSDIIWGTTHLAMSLVTTIFQKFLHDPKVNLCRIQFRQLDYRRCFEYFFRFNPNITRIRTVLILDFDIPNEPESLFQIRFIRHEMNFFKFKQRLQQRTREGHVELNTAQVMEIVNSYV